MAAGREPLTRLGDRSADKTTRMGDLDLFSFSDCEYIEGMTLTQHLNQMKLSAFVTIAAVIGGSFLVPVPAQAGVLVDIKKGIEYQVNDGNPRLAITDGNRATVFKNSKYEYPLGSNFGETKTFTLGNSQNRAWAEDLTKCNASVGGSWDTEFTYGYYVESDLWLCR